MPARILVLAASARPDTPAARLAAEAARRLALGEAEIVYLSLGDHELPLHDPDDPDPALPLAAERLARQIARQDGLFLAFTPFEGSLPAYVKNALEWTGRARTDGGRPRRPFEALPVALVAVGEAGAPLEGGLEAAQATLEALGADVLDGASPHDLERLLGDLLERTRSIGRFG